MKNLRNSLTVPKDYILNFTKGTIYCLTDKENMLTYFRPKKVRKKKSYAAVMESITVRFFLFLLMLLIFIVFVEFWGLEITEINKDMPS